MQPVDQHDSLASCQASDFLDVHDRKRKFYQADSDKFSRFCQYERKRRRSCGTVIKSCHLSLVIIICVAGHFEQGNSALTDFPRDKKKVDP